MGPGSTWLTALELTQAQAAIRDFTDPPFGSPLPLEEKTWLNVCSPHSPQSDQSLPFHEERVGREAHWCLQYLCFQ